MTNSYPRPRMCWFRAASAALTLLLVPAVVSAQAAPAKKDIEALAAAAAPAMTPAGQPFSGPVYVGALIGPDFPGGTNENTGFKVLGYGAVGVMQLMPQLNLDLLAHFGYVYNGGPSLIGFIGGVPVEEAISSHIFEIVPAARLRYAFSDVLSFYGDAGIGLAWRTGNVSQTVAGTTFSTSTTDTNGLFRISGGVMYALSDQFSVQFEPVGLNFYFGTNSSFHYSLLAGVAYRL